MVLNLPPSSLSICHSQYTAPTMLALAGHLAMVERLGSRSSSMHSMPDFYDQAHSGRVTITVGQGDDAKDFNCQRACCVPAQRGLTRRRETAAFGRAEEASSPSGRQNSSLRGSALLPQLPGPTLLSHKRREWLRRRARSSEVQLRGLSVRGQASDGRPARLRQVESLRDPQAVQERFLYPSQDSDMSLRTRSTGVAAPYSYHRIPRQTHRVGWRSQRQVLRSLQRFREERCQAARLVTEGLHHR